MQFKFNAVGRGVKPIGPAQDACLTGNLLHWLPCCLQSAFLEYCDVLAGTLLDIGGFGTPDNAFNC